MKLPTKILLTILTLLIVISLVLIIAGFIFGFDEVFSDISLSNILIAVVSGLAIAGIIVAIGNILAKIWK